MTTYILVAVVVVLAVAVALLSAGLVEVYAELAQVRSVLHLQDQPSPLHLPTLGRPVAELMPEPPPVLRPDPARPEHCVLVLSNGCAVCHTIGTDLARALPDWADRLTILVASDSGRAGEEFVSELGLKWPRLVVDEMGLTAKQLGIDNSPTVVRIVNGRLDAAANLTSARQLEVFVSGRPS